MQYPRSRIEWICEITELMKKMEDYQGKKVKVIATNGEEYTGYLNYFESRYDNDGEASVALFDENGKNGLGFEESDIKDIVPI